jgi:lipid II:glycine glycyltransferase (peptidoglycan interpeptide bridge formation enzyme)
MEIIKNGKLDREKWNLLLKDNIFASPFQTLEFYQFINSVHDYSAEVFAVQENNNYTSLILIVCQKEIGIKSFFSRRGIVYGGPLIRNGNKGSLTFLLREIRLSFVNRIIYLEVRNLFNYSDFRNVYLEEGFIYEPWLNFKNNTVDYNNMISSISSSRLRQIKKALNEGVSWREADSIDDVKKFYKILLSLYKKKIKKPLPTESFFTGFYKFNLGKFLLVNYKDRIIGGIMCPVLKDKVIYEFYVCGMDNEYRKQYPSVIATWAAMEFAHHNNIKYFDFMGAGKPNEEYGVREFKARFGGALVENGRFLLIFKPLLYRIGELGLKILAKISK